MSQANRSSDGEAATRRQHARSLCIQRASAFLLVLPAAAALCACADAPEAPPAPAPVGNLRAALAGTWADTGELGGGRAGHTATLLLDGRALVVGGEDGGSSIASAELFDPQRGTWAGTAPLPAAAAWHTATLLLDGRVLVAGGERAGAALPEAGLYDPVTGSWALTDSMLDARSYHTATLLPDGRVLVVGGHDAALAERVLLAAEIFDPAAGGWTSAAPPAERRDGHTATLLPGGLVLVAGGADRLASSQTAELFDPVAGTWLPTGPMALARTSHTATLLASGLVLVSGGVDWPADVSLRQAELYDPVTGTFATTASMAGARFRHAAALLPSGLVLVSGGTGGAATLSSVELYDPVARRWTTTGPMGRTRERHTTTLLPSGHVLAAGGTAIRTAELYDSGAATGCVVCPGDGSCATLLAGVSCGVCLECDGAGACGQAPAGSSCGLCASCDGGGFCSQALADDDACGTIACGGLSDACRGYDDVTTARCASAGACKPANTGATCTVFEDLAAGTRCGTCSACDGAGSCADPLADDDACGTLDCGGLSAQCRTYEDVRTARCAGLGSCKTANTPSTCTQFSDAAAGSDCGLCAACDGLGACEGIPADDSDCGTIDCSSLNRISACRTYADLRSARCAAAGECKAPDQQSCTDTTDAPEGTGCGEGSSCASEGVLRRAWSCGGGSSTGECLERGTQVCAPFACVDSGGAQCLFSCTSDRDCSAGNVCTSNGGGGGRCVCTEFGCPAGNFCGDDGACSACDTDDHCGPDCLPCNDENQDGFYCETSGGARCEELVNEDELQYAGGGLLSCNCGAAGGAPASAVALVLLLGLGWLAGPGRGSRLRRAGWLSLLSSLALWSLPLLPLLLPAAAAAQNGFSSERFHPAPGSQNLLTLFAARTCAPGDFESYLLLNHAQSPLAAYEGGTNVFQVVEARETVDVLGTYGLLPRLDIGWDLPVIVRQSTGAAPGDAYARLAAKDVKEESFAFGDLRAIPKFTLLDEAGGWGPAPAEDPLAGSGYSYDGVRRGLGLAIALPITLPTGNQEAYLGSGSAGIEPRLVADLRAGGLVYAANLGWAFSGGSSELNVGGGSELRYGAGVLLPVAGDVVAVAELFGSIDEPAEGRSWSSRSLPMELLGVVRYLSELGISGQVGGGFGVTDGVGTPSLRVLGKVGYSPADSSDRRSASSAAYLAALEKPSPPPPPPPAPPPPPPPPAPKPVVAAVTVTETQLEINQQVFFEFGSDRLLPVSFAILDEVAKALGEHAEIELVEIGGHTDDVGGEEANLLFSQKRAEAVRKYLLGKGLPVGRLIPTGYGQRIPLEANTTDEGRAKNRRVEFRIVKRKGKAR